MAPEGDRPDGPIEPTRYGVEKEPWARYTGVHPLLRLLTAIISRRRDGRRMPSLWVGLLHVLVGGALLVVVLGGVTLLFFVLARLLD